jgi:hypothetical protein
VQLARTTPGGIGPAAAPVRAAARVDLMSVAFANGTTVVSRFSSMPSALEDGRFSGPAVQALPRYEAAARIGDTPEAFN